MASFPFKRCIKLCSAIFYFINVSMEWKSIINLGPYSKNRLYTRFVYFSRLFALRAFLSCILKHWNIDVEVVSFNWSIVWAGRKETAQKWWITIKWSLKAQRLAFILKPVLFILLILDQYVANCLDCVVKNWKGR